MKDYIQHILQGILILMLFPATANKIVVAQNGKVSSIKAAIELANPGDTILVKYGRYSEGNIRITKPVVLLGEGKPIVDGEHKTEVFTVEAERVTIEGFQIANTGVSSMKVITWLFATTILSEHSLGFTFPVPTTWWWRKTHSRHR
jgi:nitrous oxidase accessory protein